MYFNQSDQIISKFENPFDHFVIDNFLEINWARLLSNDFLDYNDSNWFYYDTPLENKRTLNDYHRFPKETYKFLQYLNSTQFIQYLENLTGIKNLYPDYGLHGAGWHCHSTGGKLNIHLDYNLHPKLDLQRKLNLILYLTENWDKNWGGGLELWTHNHITNQPKEKYKNVENVFNRAIVFDTTQNSWHGFPNELICPKNVYRKSIAMYYLIDPPENTVKRMRALYAPREDQKDNLEIRKLIEQRSKL